MCANKSKKLKRQPSGYCKKIYCIALVKHLLLLLVVASISSCATVFGRWNNSLVLKNDSGQMADVYLDGEHIGQAPGKIKLHSRRIQHGSQLVLENESGRREYTILRRPSTAYLIADIVSTAGVALVVDFADGQIYRPKPRMIEYDLSENNPQK
jgi:hypothetical protein